MEHLLYAAVGGVLCAVRSSVVVVRGAATLLIFRSMRLLSRVDTMSLFSSSPSVHLSLYIGPPCIMLDLEPFNMMS